MRKTTIKLTKSKVGDRVYHCVTFPKIGAGRQRRFFKDQKEAKTFFELKKVEKENHGAAGLSLSDAQRAEYLDCRRLLEPFNASLREAVAFYLPHVKARNGSCSITDLVERLLKEKQTEGKSERYQKDLRLRLGAFATAYPAKLAAEVTHSDVEGWLHGLGLSPVSRNNYRRVLVVLFNFAKAHNFCVANPAELVGQAKVIDKPPGILSPDQAASLLERADAELIPYIAIGLFAGLRRAELQRLDWREIKLAQGFIEVSAKNSKTARRRLVHVETNLAEWLRPYVKVAGQVCPINFENLFERARSEAGIADWPDNALRHSFASFHLAKFCDAGRTALELGHSDTKLLFTAYREICTKADAERYWSITPSVAANVVAISA